MSDVTDTPDITLADLRRLADSRSPDFANAVIAFLEQPEIAPTTPVREGAITLDALVSGVVSNSTRKHGGAQANRTLWKDFLAQTDPVPPQRLGLCELLVEVYERNDPSTRDALIDIIARAPLRFGLWGAIKRIYKRSEERHDAPLFGAIAARVDQGFGNKAWNQEVTPWTLLYLRRRAWRYLRELAMAAPGLYPDFAVEVLRRYGPETNFPKLWVANHIWLHRGKGYNWREFYASTLPSDLVKNRAFDDAWKRSPAPLMSLLETCASDPAARFAIGGLRKDFPDALSGVSPAWLASLAQRPLAVVHDFLTDTLEAAPEFHQGKLRALGLHDTVLALLTSPSNKARAYAIAYARAHGQDLSQHRLLALLECGLRDTASLAASMLQSRAPGDLGPHSLARMLLTKETAAWAKKQLDGAFERSDFSPSFLRDMLFGAPSQRQWVKGWLDANYKPQELGSAFWMAVVDDRRGDEDDDVRRQAFTQLAKYPAEEIGAPWLLRMLTSDDGNSFAAQSFRKATKLKDLDVEALKALAFDTRWRASAFEVLGNTKLLSVRDLGVPWLLAMARRTDPTSHEFASRYLLEHVKPADFSETGDDDQGTEKLFTLALGAKEPESVRSFAQTYLLCHHPVITKENPLARGMKLKAQLTRAVYTPEKLWPALWDMRADVRRFAVTVARVELRAWGFIDRVYELAESEDRDVRALAYNALRNAGESGADAGSTLQLAELDASKIFALTESRRKPTREVGMEIIRKHYARIGGAERLGWLMESPDREVRLFSVRLLWEKHRPRETPDGWSPKGKHLVTSEASERFENSEALRGFLRRVLYGIAPGRMERRESAAVRKIPASVAKRNVIEVVRDMGVEDVVFARLAAPVLGEFTGSLARGEWQACLSALAFLRSAHPTEPFGGIER